MADSTISGLTAATALQAADLAAVVQGGTTKKATLAQIQANSLPLAGGTMTGALVAPPSSFTNSASSNFPLTIGSDTSLPSLTDATTKVGRVVVPHYTNTEQPVLAFMATTTSTANIFSVGGGTSLANAATSMSFYAAANNTTVTGTSMMQIRTQGIRIQSGATTAASSLFHVAATGDANALRVDDTTGDLSSGTAPVSGIKLTVERAANQLRLRNDSSNFVRNPR